MVHRSTSKTMPTQKHTCKVNMLGKWKTDFSHPKCMSQKGVLLTAERTFALPRHSQFSFQMSSVLGLPLHASAKILLGLWTTSDPFVDTFGLDLLEAHMQDLQVWLRH